jgi:hypothetical protein
MGWIKEAGTRRAALSLLAFVMLVPFGATAAEQGVLIERLPAGIDRASALGATREALANREWIVVGQDAESISAKITRAGLDAKIRISVSGEQLRYETSATGKGRMDHTGRVTPAQMSTPSRWIGFLRSDITENLQTRVAAAAKNPSRAGAVEAPPTGAAAARPTAARAPSVQRMQDLKDLFDKGLISADEYAAKRAEILKDL